MDTPIATLATANFWLLLEKTKSFLIWGQFSNLFILVWSAFQRFISSKSFIPRIISFLYYFSVYLLSLFFLVHHIAWDGWMASPTRRTGVWVNSACWWWTGRLGVLRSLGSQRVGPDWATELTQLVGSLSPDQGQSSAPGRERAASSLLDLQGSPAHLLTLFNCSAEMPQERRGNSTHARLLSKPMGRGSTAGPVCPCSQRPREKLITVREQLSTAVKKKGFLLGIDAE